MCVCLMLWMCVVVSEWNFGHAGEGSKEVFAGVEASHQRGSAQTEGTADQQNSQSKNILSSCLHQVVSLNSKQHSRSSTESFLFR